MPARFARKLASKVRSRASGVKARLGIDAEYEVAPGTTITLPADHLLPLYRAAHPDYDRFLPHLAAALEEGDAVVDVGANCGDTLAAMYAANPNLRFTCVEPDPRFGAYLDRNIERLRGNDPALSVKVVRAMIGRAISGAVLTGKGGTAKQVVGGGSDGHATRTLDSVLPVDDHALVRLLKSDVDGFDYDVLDAAEAVIAAAEPLLFFECQLDHDFQKAGYERTIKALADRGYSHWTVFDNFGAPLLTTGDTGQIVMLLDYVWRQNRGEATRTIHYFDLFAATADDAAFAAQVVATYTGRGNS